MLFPKDPTRVERQTLRNSSGKDIRFDGWLLAKVTNFNPNAVDKSTNVQTGSQRWKERAVYQTEGGKIVCHKLGCSRVPGEVDRGEVLVIDHKPHVAMTADDGRTTVTSIGMAASPVELDQAIIQFFGNDPLAKSLLAKLEIDDVDDLDEPARTPRGFVVDIDNLPPLFPTNRHAPEFWTPLCQRERDTRSCCV